MNNIIFAGSPDKLFPCRKGITVAVALSCGEVGHKGRRDEYKKGDIIILPPCAEAYFTDNSVTAAVICRAVFQCPAITVLADDGGEILHAVRQAEKYISHTSSQSALILSALGNLIIGYIQLLCADKELSPVTRKLMSEIDERLTDPTFNADDAVKKLPLNGDYVRRLFKKETGVTPHAYLLQKRMELAESLILGNAANRYSNYTVSQIAEACGFAEPLYFSRVFKKYFGTPPSRLGKN